MIQPPLKPQNAHPPSTHAPSTNAAGERPGCVTVYAVLLGIAAVIFALVGWIGGSNLMSEGDDETGLLILSAGTVGAVLYFAIARGLWRMRKWSRVLVMVVTGLGMVGNLIALGGLLTGSISGQVLVSSVISLIVGGYILYWFYDNGHLFS